MSLTQIQDQPANGVRINKETGELSASGELSVSVELKTKILGSSEDPQPQNVLIKQLHELRIHSYFDQKNDKSVLAPKEEELATVLSLYIQICEDGGTVEDVNLRGLAALTADTVIQNIHRRLAEKPADEARKEVVHFFQKEDTSTNFKNRCFGWLLLKSLSLLTADGSALLSSLNLELPVALVKCLYLLVCLPPSQENQTHEHSFQEPLTQVFLHLCTVPVNVEKLVETEELHCLIIGLTSLWEQTNASWRHQSSRVLKALSASATRNMIPSLFGKHCIRICIQNLLHIRTDISGPLLAEVAVVVFNFIKDTYDINPALFEEFETSNGYRALENIMKCCEAGVPDDQFLPVEELIALIATFIMFGKTELKVALCISNPQPPGFKFDAPQTTGAVVKNLPAFLLLQGSLLRSQDSQLCCQILQTMQRIWEKETANFFLLEWSVQTMTQLASCVLSKPAAVHRQFFSLLEMIIFKLNFIPHETLRAVLTVLKQMWTRATSQQTNGLEFGVAAVKCFHRITAYSGLLTEVLSDLGLLKLLLGELRRRAKILIKAVAVTTDTSQFSHIDDNESLLTNHMLQVVSTFTLRSIKNIVSVRELGMIPYIKIFLNEDQYRDSTLSILEQLAEINPEEFMSIAIGALCSSTQQEIRLKKDLLQSVLKVLESPNSWDAFRKAGGFTGLLSLVTDMEGAFANPPRAEALKSIGHERLLKILLLTLHTIALAVHIHRINGHCFETGGYYERLTEALLHLGCFHCKTSEENSNEVDNVNLPLIAEDNQSPKRTFEQFVCLAESSISSQSSLSKSESQLMFPVTLRTCILLLSFLNQFSTGTFSSPELNLDPNCDDQKPNIPAACDGVEDKSRKAAPSFSLASTESHCRLSCDSVILHPGAIRVIMTLFPLVFTLEDPQLSMDVQYSIVHHIQVMVKLERNRQIMCEGGLIATLLAHCGQMLIEPKHPLHLPVTRILEKLSSQSITLKDFRNFLCLGNPLMCLSDKMAQNDLENEKTPDSSDGGHSSESSRKTTKRTFSLLNSKCSVGSAIPAHQIVSLISMTSPRSYRPHKISTTPAFVEFDMNESGYGCLFLPSLATVKGVNADSIPIGGTGGDCRGFPPTAGLTYSCWFQINRFSSACESHPIRFLSVVRHMSRTEQQFICLSISLSACDGCLVISTEEEALTYLDMMEPEFSSPTSLATSLRFRCSSQLIPGQWHHLVVVLAKDIKKSCLASAYLNGKAVGTGKMRYIQPFPGTYVSMEPTAVTDVYAVIGTPALWKDYAALIWKAGPSYLFEEPLTSEAISVLYSQGTAYLGNFLSVCKSGVESNPVRLVPEERISFGINPAISTVTTVAQIREDYNEVDCRLIAKEVGITSRDNSTPVFLARNISQHLSGTARTIGAALVGHFGVRAFTPKNAPNGFLCVGGPAVVLSLVAMAPDDSSLYAAVKVLLSVLETDSTMQQEMARIDGYKLLAFLLKSKSSIVSNRTLQLVLCLSDSTEANFSSIYQQNLPAFRALISDLDVWQTTSDNLDLTVLNHFAEVLQSFSDDNRNAGIIHKIGILPKMLFVLTNPSMNPRRVEVISSVITLLLKECFNPLDIHRLGLFLVYTLPPQSNTTEIYDRSDSHHNTSAENSGPVSHIYVRNQILFVLDEILNNDKLQEKQGQVLFETLGCGWFLLFLQSHLHPSTIKLGLVLLNHILLSPSRLNIFREGVSSCSLMEEPSFALDNRVQSSSVECPKTACSGFDVLKELLASSSLSEVYEFMVALLLGKRLNHKTKENLPLEGILQTYIDLEKKHPAEQLCVEAATILLELIKVTINPSIVGVKQTSKTSMSQPGLVSSVMQFFCLLHDLRPRDPLWTLSEFLQTLASVVHPSQALGDECETILQKAPSKKPVCDFLHILLLDSLHNSSASSSHPVVILMEFSPDGASLEQSLLFQTELVEFVIDIIYVLSGEEENHMNLTSKDCNTLKPEGHLNTLMENAVLFTQTVVQKLYSGTTAGDCRSLLHFIADQIVLVLENGQAQKDKMLSEFYSCINRVMLFFLSQHKDVVIRTLETVLDRWDVVMATYNANVNFMTCFLYCLLMTQSGRFPEGFECTYGKVHDRNVASQIFPVKIRHDDNKSGSSSSSISDDQRLESLVEACWSRLMKERQWMLEESFKTEISASNTAKTQPVLMTEISPLWEEIIHKGWQLHTDSLKRMFSSSQKTFDRISSAVSSVLSKLSKEPSTVAEFLFSMELIRQDGQKMFERMRMNHIQQKASEWERLSSKWLDVEAELLRERAIFGPGPGVLLSRDWVQDAAEGPNRTKPHIRRKTQRKSTKVMVPLCLGSGSGEAETEAKILCEVGAEVKENMDEEQDSIQLTFFPVLSETPASAEAASEPSSSTNCSQSTDCSSIRIILQELQEGDKVKAKMCIVTVSGLRVTEGVLLFGKDSLYLCEGFTLSSTGEVCCRNHHPSSVRNSYIASMLSKDPPVFSCRRWLHQEIKDARFMRYLLEDNALEIFMKNGHSAFLVFLNRDHVNAFKKLCLTVPSLKGRGVTEVIANARKVPVVEKAALLKWQRGEMSNFEYLMHLNTLAGRTYNDLMQYPVFPWILADYESETLDLASPASFRDLSKPMGAQTEKRKQMFIQRFKEIGGSEGEGDLSAQCHYCTHYSSAIIVASFLVRMEPFSHTYHTLQGGFDIPERMFHSVKKEWDSASRDNMGDVRELIPEFFYLPDFLVNSNHINLGCLEDGTPLGDVELPPWAKGDPKEFIRVHREALESDYVSSHLHFWIDLVFGFKQQGPAAEESLNLFHPYFYAQRGRADSKDPLIKNLKLGYVSNFGQIPKQLFTRPHAARIGSKKEAAALSAPTPFFFKLDKLKTTTQPFRELSKGPVGQIMCVDKEVLILERNRLLLSPVLNCFFSWGFPDNSCVFGNCNSGKTFAVFEDLCVWGETLCAACPYPTTVITAGSSTVVCVWDVVVTKDRLSHMKLRQPLYGHIDAVTCLAVSEVHNILVSGSRDFTCILWDLEELNYVTQLTRHTSSVSAIAINELTGDIASCAGSQLYLWTMRGQLLARSDTSCGPQADLLCVSFSQRLDWDARNVIVTGCSDGSVRIWRTELTQTQFPDFPVEVLSMEQGRTAPANTNVAVVGSLPKTWERHLVLCHELNRGHPVSRRRYKNNPAVTALAMSRSHATLLVGDAWGRVFTWTCE
ncbi:WD repeat- and FYVE domain-containing protein 4 [Eucyclogobius newberryi]|uniref:WD repeat- and FYVE domain-containing protein 4 n=1 Tax=Eucyclogobius newberryi TaxID=166745 RepID=UPI003B5AB99A